MLQAAQPHWTSSQYESPLSIESEDTGMDRNWAGLTRWPWCDGPITLLPTWYLVPH